MFKQSLGVVGAGLLSVVWSGSAAAAATGFEVVAYNPGTETSLTNTDAALGTPDPIVGEGSGFENVLSPFSPAYESSQILRMQGDGAGVTIKLSNYAISTAGLELGVISNVGLIDADWPNGQATDPAATFGTPRSAEVQVSENGVDFVSLGTQLFDNPANYFLDAASPYDSEPGSVVADFGKAFDGSLSDFSGLNYDQMLTLLDGSVGGTWLDISGSGLSQVGYVRFNTVADNGYDFVIDSLLVASDATGAAVPEPAAGVVLLSLLALRRRRSAIG